MNFFTMLTKHRQQNKICLTGNQIQIIEITFHCSTIELQEQYPAWNLIALLNVSKSANTTPDGKIFMNRQHCR